MDESKHVKNTSFKPREHYGDFTEKSDTAITMTGT